jgi:flavin reductase (DIM6/NTAB) family NADH-FMN oxidoreductase RutF
VIDRETFFALMGAFPTGVAVVTTLDADGVPRGLTTNAVTSVSADPPSLLVCVDNGSRTLPALLHTGRFVVNFMAVGTDDVCGVFASRAEDKFVGLEWTAGAHGLPRLDFHAVAWAECMTDQVVQAGDHVVLIAHVEAGRAPLRDDHPAVYFRRGYAAVAVR